MMGMEGNGNPNIVLLIYKDRSNNCKEGMRKHKCMSQENLSKFKTKVHSLFNDNIVIRYIYCNTLIYFIIENRLIIPGHNPGNETLEFTSNINNHHSLKPLQWLSPECNKTR